jgi:hypothetical protein
MRAVLLMFGVASLSACISIPDAIIPLTAEQTAAIERDCGRRPMSLLKSSTSPRVVTYSACKRKTLQRIANSMATTNAN